MKRFICLFIAAFGWISTASAAVLVVDSTFDTSPPTRTACTAAPGDCSLPGALVRAMNGTTNPGDDDIHFNIPLDDAGCDADSGVCRIVLNGSVTVGVSPSQGLTIDGYTQPGASPNTLPFEQGTNAQIRIEVTGQDLTFRNPFTIRGIAFGIPVNVSLINGQSSSRYEFEGNFFGLRADGVTPFASTGIQLHLIASIGNNGVRIGGLLPAQRNVFGSSAGFNASTPTQECLRNSEVNTIIQNNLIGTDRTGLLPRGCITGLLINRTGTLLGGLDENAGNVIGSHLHRAFQISSSGTVTRILGNLIGMGADGATPLPNVSLMGVDATSTIRGDNSASFVRIEDNLIAYSGLNRPRFPATPPFQQIPGIGNAGRWEVLGNRFLGNKGQPLNLGQSSSFVHLPNDADDADSSSFSRQQNFPVITAFSRMGDTLDLTYSVDSSPQNSQYPLAIEFYRDDGLGGFVPLGRDEYTLAQAQTSVTASFDLPDGVTLGEGDVIVATATSAPQDGAPTGETSELGFYPILLAFSGVPNNVQAGRPATIQVRATALSGPFPPNGVVTLTLNSTPTTHCELSLQPAPQMFESTGSCILIPPQAGNFNVQAYYDAARGSFATANGSSIVLNQPLSVAQPLNEQIGFLSCRAVALEGRTLEIPIHRPSGGQESVSVTLEHIAGTATPGVDYTTPATQTFSWAPGDVSPRVVTIPIASDGIAEPTETFRLRLTDPQNASIQPHALMEISILDGDDQGFRDGFDGGCPQ